MKRDDLRSHPVARQATTQRDTHASAFRRIHHAKRLAVFLLALILTVSCFPGTDGSMLRADAATITGEATLQAKLAQSVLLYVGSNLARVRDVLTPIDPGRNGTAPFLVDGRTMVPVRFLAESAGATVSFDASTGVAVIRLGTRTLKLRGGSVNLTVNGTTVRMPVAPVLRNSRLYAPLRSVTEALGFGIFYDSGLICVSPGQPFLDPVRDAALLDGQRKALGMVRVAGSEDELMAQLSAWQASQSVAYYKSDALPSMALPELAASEGVSATGQAADAAPAPSASASAEGAATDSGDIHSTTNVQVEGVDEGDILKTDGNYLFQINRTRVMVIRAVPADAMKLLATIQLGAESITPSEIYVADDRLTIIGTTVANLPVAYDAGSAISSATGTVASTRATIAPSIGIVSPDMPPIEPGLRYMPPQPGVMTTKVLTYDLTDPSNPARTGTYEIEGSLLASRRVGSHLYVVTNKTLSPWLLGTEPDTPYWRSGTGAYQRIAPTTVTWCPDFEEANYLVVSGLDLSKPSQAPGMYTLLGAGQTVYATADSLFVAVQRGQPGNVILPATLVLPGAMKASGGGILPTTESTDIYRFALQDGNAALLSRGTVPGRLLNQFSMDWYGDALRVATTTGWASRTGAPTSANQVYTLDAMLNILGGIPDIAPGEQIYSARFLGNRGFLVTYRTTDPLYALDLTDPKKPYIKGELKIPGYSNYLHPYDENHLIGFGKDSVELAGDWDPSTTWAYYQGMKVALFDVTNLSSPRLMDELHIGDRGTTSELLDNHRALLFSKTRSLIAFPVSLYKVGGAVGVTGTGDTTSSVAPQSDPLAYGELAWQGLTAYRVTLAAGFSKLADISHLEPGDLWNQDRYVQRGAYIGDVLYTLSNREVRAHAMTDWKEIGRLVLP